LGYHPIIFIVSFGMIVSSLPLIFLGSLVAEMAKSDSSIFNKFRIYIGFMIVIFSGGLSILLISLLLSIFLPTNSIEMTLTLLAMAFAVFSMNLLLFYARKHYLKKSQSFKNIPVDLFMHE
jgi:hypothetical protein